MRKSALFLVSLTLLFAVSLGACNPGPSSVTSSEPPPKPDIASKIYANPAHNFSIEYPADWQYAANPTPGQGSQGVVVTFIGPASTETAGIAIQADKWPAPATLEQYAAAVEEQVLKKDLADYVKSKEVATSMGGMPAITRIFTATINDLPRKFAQIYFVNKEFGYAISYSNSPDSFDAFYNSFELAVSTFKFN
jgi:hypothetical protein